MIRSNPRYVIYNINQFRQACKYRLWSKKSNFLKFASLCLKITFTTYSVKINLIIYYYSVRSASMCQRSLATLNTNKNVTLSTERSQSTSLSRSATPSRIRLRDRCPDRCVTRSPGRSASRCLYPRLSIDQRLAVIL